ncbi:MAG: flagellar basal body P-ring formation chaperone FlgA, partial [Armatimonadetes bacterium]|nr:flagellar basal body P-ring formation chaperone FlgA [Armatimonadota bacterium]
MRLLTATLILMIFTLRTAGASATHKLTEGSSRHKVLIIVQPNTTVNTGHILLGEIADIAGSDSHLVTELKSLDVGVSPLAGLYRILLPSDIMVRLRFNHIDLNRIAITIPKQVRVSRSAANVTGEQMLQAAIAAVKSAMKDTSGVKIKPVQIPQDASVPEGVVTVTAGAPEGQLNSGIVTVPVTISVNNRPNATIDVPLRIQKTAMVVVAEHPLEAQTIIGPNDVTLAPVVLQDGAPDTIYQLSDAIGKKTTRRILEGSPIPVNAVQLPSIIASGDRIIVEIMVGGVTAQ